MVPLHTEFLDRFGPYNNTGPESNGPVPKRQAFLMGCLWDKEGRQDSPLFGWSFFGFLGIYCCFLSLFCHFRPICRKKCQINGQKRPKNAFSTTKNAEIAKNRGKFNRERRQECLRYTRANPLSPSKRALFPIGAIWKSFFPKSRTRFFLKRDGNKRWLKTAMNGLLRPTMFSMVGKCTWNPTMGTIEGHKFGLLGFPGTEDQIAQDAVIRIGEFGHALHQRFGELEGQVIPPLFFVEFSEMQQHHRIFRLHA